MTGPRMGLILGWSLQTSALCTSGKQKHIYGTRPERVFWCLKYEKNSYYFVKEVKCIKVLADEIVKCHFLSRVNKNGLRKTDKQINPVNICTLKRTKEGGTEQ